MFEDNTYENLLQSALSKIPIDIDKREGSIIYDAIAPFCFELAQTYVNLDLVLKESFADTSSRKYLIKRAIERGLKPYPATPSVILVTINGVEDIEIGERFVIDDLIFEYCGAKTDGKFEMICTKKGEVGNISSGELRPINNIPDFTNAFIDRLHVRGRNEEDTEAFRNRYFKSFNIQAFGGNREDYRNNIYNLNNDNIIISNGGIGGIKLYRPKTGGGYINVYIINNNFEPPTTSLINLIQDKVDPVRDTGNGIGFAPIGHKVTILPVNGVEITVNIELELKDNVSLEQIKPLLEEKLNAYIKEVAKEWENESNLTIRVRQLESKFFEVQGVQDIKRTTINGASENLVLNENEVPVMEGLNVNQIFT